MFELLGMKPSDEIIGFSAVNRLIHPEDLDLYAVACEVTEQGLEQHAARVGDR